MKGISRTISLVVGFVIAVAAIVVLVAIGDAGASNLESFFFENSGLSSPEGS